ncbi:MAG: DUF4988 domain-containing protein [Tannerella sp.]|jgi:hypothetical protein|nr:DUF4988 domain-containing protein [Tannerella sp.]
MDNILFKSPPKILSIILTALLLGGNGCQTYDDSKVWDELNNQSKRLAALKAWQTVVNDNFGSLHTLVAALQNNDYVTDVTKFDDPAPGGYYIHFATSERATVWNGADGITPQLRISDTTGEWEVCLTGDCDPATVDWTSTGIIAAPQIGAAEDPPGSGIYYWTVNGNRLLNSSDDKIPVTGPQGPQGPTGNTPKVAIGSDNYWYICPDGSCTNTPPGTGWNNTTVKDTGAQGDVIFAEDGIDNTHDDYVEFTLADGYTTIKLPKYVPLGITFDPPASFNNGETKTVTLTAVTGSVQSITPVDVPRGWTVEPKLDENKITVIAPANDGKYYTAAGTVKLLVSDDALRTIIKPLYLSCPACTPPEKLGITFDQPAQFGWGGTKEAGFTTQGNATTVKVLDVPAGWAVAVAKSGNTGKFTITAPDDADASPGEAVVLAADADGNTVMRTLKLAFAPTMLCTQCGFDGSSWVDCYVTTYAYPFDNNTTSNYVQWSGNGTDHYDGARSDKDGRANTAVISSQGTSAVQLCKDLGTG